MIDNGLKDAQSPQDEGCTAGPSSRSDECKEWLKNPLINPRTHRKIKVGDPIYKQLQKECEEVPSITIVSDVGLGRQCSKIEIVSLPITPIEPPKMDVTISSNNDARLKKNAYLGSLTFKPSNNEDHYIKAFGNVFRKNVAKTFPIWNNDMIKYVPNFVHVFNDLVTEPYTDLDNDNLVWNNAMLFDLIMLQAVLYQFPDQNIHVKNPKICVLKCDKVTHDLITINNEKYFRPPSQYRFCLTPESYYNDTDQPYYTDDNSPFEPYYKGQFLQKMLETETAKFPQLNRADGFSVTKRTNVNKKKKAFLQLLNNEKDKELAKYIRILAKTYKHFDYDNRSVRKVLSGLSQSGQRAHADNTFPFPMKIEKNIYYFNVLSTIEQNERNLASIDTFVRVLANNNTHGIYNQDDVERLGFRKLPFNLVFHEDFNPEGITINPEFIDGPYMIKYNRHKLFTKTRYIRFESNSSYVDPRFFTMFTDDIQYTFYYSSLLNIEEIDLRDCEGVTVIDINPNFIFNLKKINFLKTLESINVMHFASEEYNGVPPPINEASNIDLRLFEAFYINKIDEYQLPDRLEIHRFNTVIFPETFAFLSKRLYILFKDCNITSFHPSLFTTNLLSVYFDNCSLSENSIRSILENLDSIPQERRPRIIYTIYTLNPTGNELIPLNEIVKLIFRIHDGITNAPTFKNITCKQPLTSWLNRIYNESSTTIVKQLIPHIIEMLHEMDRNSEFMEESCNIIEGATATCGDRMILSILYVSLQFKMHILANDLDKVEEIAGFLIRGPFIMSELEKIARAKINTLYVVDEIEVYLAYPIKLRDHFNIPIETKDMLYYACSSIGPSDLASARAAIETKLRDKELIAEFLATQPLWTKIIYARNPNIFEEVATLQDNLIKETKQIIAHFNTLVTPSLQRSSVSIKQDLDLD